MHPPSVNKKSWSGIWDGKQESWCSSGINKQAVWISTNEGGFGTQPWAAVAGASSCIALVCWSFMFLSLVKKGHSQCRWTWESMAPQTGTCHHRQLADLWLGDRLWRRCRSGSCTKGIDPQHLRHGMTGWWGPLKSFKSLSTYIEADDALFPSLLQAQLDFLDRGRKQIDSGKVRWSRNYAPCTQVHAKAAGAYWAKLKLDLALGPLFVWEHANGWSKNPVLPVLCSSLSWPTLFVARRKTADQLRDVPGLCTPRPWVAPVRNFP